MSDDALVELETKLAYQEDTLQALNDALCRQQQRIDQLELQIKLVAQRLEETVPAGDKASHEIPPHY